MSKDQTTDTALMDRLLNSTIRGEDTAELARVVDRLESGDETPAVRWLSDYDAARIREITVRLVLLEAIVSGLVAAFAVSILSLLALLAWAPWR